MSEEVKKHCPSCGAPLTTEICPYCRNATGLNTAEADMEYPVIECKEANIGFWNFTFPMIFAISFGFFGFIYPLIFLLSDSESAITVVLACGMFGFIGVVGFGRTLYSLIKYFKVKIKGKEIEATVYGYINDNVFISGAPAQIVKLQVSTGDGPKFILYQLGDTKQPYKINSKIKLLVYKNIFLVKKDEQIHF